ncbi:cation efflux family protein [Seiridium cupressi]
MAPPSLATTANPADPLDIGRLRHENVSEKQMKIEYPSANKREMRKFYARQNDLIDQYLGSNDEERVSGEESDRVGPKIKFAINASFTVNFCLFVIQLYAAITTGSLSLFATAADAFMDLVSSCVMLATSCMASKPKLHKFPVGRTRMETIGVILFCALMTTVAIELLVSTLAFDAAKLDTYQGAVQIESGRTLGSGHSESGEQLNIAPLICVCVAIAAKFSLMCAICIALLILFSWVSNAFEQVWLLVGKGAPPEYISKLIYIAMTHDPNISKVDTCRAYHAGQRCYVEIDIVMDPETPLRHSHDVSQSLQRKLEGLADVERAFVHVDYEYEHDVHEEHKPLFDRTKS